MTAFSHHFEFLGFVDRSARLAVLPRRVDASSAGPASVAEARWCGLWLTAIADGSSSRSSGLRKWRGEVADPSIGVGDPLGCLFGDRSDLVTDHGQGLGESV